MCNVVLRVLLSENDTKINFFNFRKGVYVFMKKSVAVLLWVLVLAVVAFAAGHVVHIDPATNQSTASSISAEDVTALSSDGNTYVDASTLQSIIANTSDATEQQKNASTAASSLSDNTTVVSFATVDTSTLEDGVVIPIKVDASQVSDGSGLYAYIGGVLYEGGDNMYLREVNGSTYICIKWEDVLDGNVVGAGVDASGEDDLLTPVAVSSTGGNLGGSGGGCSTGMSALAFGVLGLFLACRKK